jgi:hypothetical protein
VTNAAIWRQNWLLISPHQFISLFFVVIYTDVCVYHYDTIGSGYTESKQSKASKAKESKAKKLKKNYGVN